MCVKNNSCYLCSSKALRNYIPKPENYINASLITRENARKHKRFQSLERTSTRSAEVRGNLYNNDFLYKWVYSIFLGINEASLSEYVVFF